MLRLALGNSPLLFFSHLQVKQWVALFLSMGNHVVGYDNARITPYLHILVYHVPQFLEDQIPVKFFTGQGIEKINDIARSIYHNKSNRHDACKEAVLALKRIDHLQGSDRKPNCYQKRSNEYWSSDIYEQRRKKPRMRVDVRDDEDTQSMLIA